jgi:hypothetical protein
VNVLAQLTALKEMTLNELKAKWGTIFATPAPDNSRGYLALRIGHRIQELIHGALSWETSRTLDLLSDTTKNKDRPPLDRVRCARPLISTQWSGFRFFGLRAAGKPER